VFAEVESMSRRVLAPSVRLAVLAAENGVFVSNPADGFRLLAGRVDVCPLRLGSRDLSLRPCVASDGGGLRAEGIDVTTPRTVVVAWFDVALLVRGRWAPGRGRFFLEAEGGILIPVTYPNFGYENPPAFEHRYTPGPGAAGSLAAGLRFW
jgi:hypothetical protein